MTHAQIATLCAEKVMGWTPDKDDDGTDYGWIGDGAFWGVKAYLWNPATDRNQSRLVVEKTQQLLDGHSESPESILYESMDGSKWAWINATPEEECLACLRALGVIECIQ